MTAVAVESWGVSQFCQPKLGAAENSSVPLRTGTLGAAPRAAWRHRAAARPGLNLPRGSLAIQRNNNPRRLCSFAAPRRRPRARPAAARRLSSRRRLPATPQRLVWPPPPPPSSRSSAPCALPAGLRRLHPPPPLLRPRRLRPHYCATPVAASAAPGPILTSCGRRRRGARPQPHGGAGSGAAERRAGRGCGRVRRRLRGRRRPAPPRSPPCSSRGSSPRIRGRSRTRARPSPGGGAPASARGVAGAGCVVGGAVLRANREHGTRSSHEAGERGKEGCPPQLLPAARHPLGGEKHIVRLGVRAAEGLRPTDTGGRGKSLQAHQLAGAELSGPHGGGRPRRGGAGKEEQGKARRACGAQGEGVGPPAP